MGKGHLAAHEESSRASHCRLLPVTSGLFGCKPWETGMARIEEASGCAAGSSLVLAAAAELEGWLLPQQCLSVRGKGGGVWSDGPAKLLLSHLCRHRVTRSGNVF